MVDRQLSVTTTIRGEQELGLWVISASVAGCSLGDTFQWGSGSTRTWSFPCEVTFTGPDAAIHQLIGMSRHFPRK
jgi:hypothetical protein